jgi:hypothetical protein
MSKEHQKQKITTDKQEKNIVQLFLSIYTLNEMNYFIQIINTLDLSIRDGPNFCIYVSNFLFLSRKREKIFFFPK